MGAELQVDITVLLPVIALTIKHLYADTKSFYAECLRVITEQYPDEIGDGLAFVKVGPGNYPDDQTYFIYTVDEDF